MKRNLILLSLASVLFSISALAAPRTESQMKQAAIQAINQLRMQKRMAPRQATELQTLQSTNHCEVIGLQQAGFAVIARDDVAPAVLGVSMARYSNGQNTNFNWWLTTMDEVLAYAANNNIQLAPVKPDPAKFPTVLAPMLTTHWDQLEPYNRLAPTSNGGDRCYTGCVATALAQVLNYHQTPEHGYG